MLIEGPHRLKQLKTKIKWSCQQLLMEPKAESLNGSENDPRRRMQTWRDDEFLLGFEFYRVQTSTKSFQERFSWNFWTSGGVMCEQFMGDYTLRDSASRQVQLFISFVDFRATSLVSVSYIFPPTVVLRTLFLILNICYELTILVIYRFSQG